MGFLIIRYNLRKICFISLIDICGNHKFLQLLKKIFSLKVRFICIT